MEKLISTNPAKNYQKIGEVCISSDLEIIKKVKLAHQVKELWKKIGLAKRIELLKPIYTNLRKRKNEFALLITKEMGKPIKESEEEIDESLKDFQWFLENASKYLADEITFQDKKQIHKIIYEPWGVAAVILPWNYPLEMFIWGVIPNLIVGNTVIAKHSEECPLVGKLCEKLIVDFKLPRGVFSEIYGNGQIGEKLVKEDINLIWFTGSSKIGKHLYKIAGKKFIKSIMELGGSSPGIILKDADLEKIISRIYSLRFSNSGQACSALKRLIVHESIFDKVVEKLHKVLITKHLGDPIDRKTDFGSLVALRQQKLVQDQVKDALEKGARIITGESIPENTKGAYYLPTLLTNIKTTMRVWKEEVFGPVLPIISFKTVEESIRLANDTNYGLAAYVFTQNKKLFLQVAEKINAGRVSQNNIGSSNNDPFGGYKDSGIGREHGRIGFHELCQIKVTTLEK